ncbi:MAG: polyprenyl synthetase family protein [Chloroflexi bacterium]|nr:polyprenyl synthetase family protein [Chloroflexota bacterium]
MTAPSNLAVETQAPTSNLQRQDWVQGVRADLEKVTEKMRSVSFLDNQLLDAAIHMIIASGGKRMRPAITMLIGRAVNAAYDPILSVAASVELLHTATLVHDDLIDSAKERRGAPTLHTALPLGVTVLTGDFLFAQSAALAAEANNVEVVKIFSRTLVSICRGEILQAQTKWQVPTLDTYIERIYGKTAALFEAAAVSGAILGEDISEDEIQAFSTFGRELGLAFQMIDDALDFVSTTEKLGKPAGNDLRQGIITLPVLYYLQNEGIRDDEAFVKSLDDPDTLEAVIKGVRDTGAARQAYELARDYVAKAEAALSGVEWSEAMELLSDLAHYAVARDF